MLRDLEGKHIAIDGKRLKGSKKKTGSTHILSHLYEDVQDCFTGQYKTHNYETLEKNHGRIEKRTYTTLSASEVFDEGNIVNGKWHLDVTFREDACRARKDYSATNLNTLRKFALAIVSQYKDKLSLRKRLFKAALNMDYLKKLLKI